MKNTVLIKDILAKNTNLTQNELKELSRAMFASKIKYEEMSLEELLYFNIVRKNPLYLKNIAHQTVRICEEAVRSFGYAIQYVRTQTENIALLAVTQDGLSLEYVDEEFHTEYVITRAINQNSLAFKFAKNKTYDICLKAVKLNGINLEFVPDEYLDDNMITTALSSNGWALKFVKEQTEKYALLAVLQNTEVSLQVDKKIRNRNPIIKLIYKEHLNRLPFTY